MMRTIFLPAKADAPLIVDTDGVASHPFAEEESGLLASEGTDHRVRSFLITRGVTMSCRPPPMESCAK
jgi:hypothetical protein